MSRQTIGFLDSYDIIGKAIPGVVFLFGLVLLLPVSTLTNANANIDIKNLAAIFVASAVAGVVFGEGVHTLARMGERVLAWIERRLTVLYRVVYELTTLVEKKLAEPAKNWLSNRFTTPIEDRQIIGPFISLFSHQFEFTKDTSIEQLRPKRINNRFQSGVASSISKFSDAFEPHRTLFEQFVSERATFTRGQGPEDIRFELFSKAITDYYDLSADAFRDADNLYPLISSHLDASSVNRSRRFQGRYSFTRGMWLSTAILALTYFGLYCFEYRSSIRPGITEFFAGSPNTAFEWTSIIFLLATFVVLFSSLIQWLGELHKDGSSGIFIPWLSGGVLTAVFVLVLRGQIRFLIEFSWLVIEGLVSEIFSFGLLMHSLISYFHGSENASNTLVVAIFDTSLLALVTLLSLSSVAFIIATGSYKRHYVEYSLIDAWESLNGEASTGISLTVEEETVEGINKIIENYSDRSLPRTGQRLRRSKQNTRRNRRDD